MLPHYFTLALFISITEEESLRSCSVFSLRVLLGCSARRDCRNFSIICGLIEMGNKGCAKGSRER